LGEGTEAWERKIRQVIYCPLNKFHTVKVITHIYI
jgi:hypothetical protein